MSRKLVPNFPVSGFTVFLLAACAPHLSWHSVSLRKSLLSQTGFRGRPLWVLSLLRCVTPEVRRALLPKAPLWPAGPLSDPPLVAPCESATTPSPQLPTLRVPVDPRSVKSMVLIMLFIVMLMKVEWAGGI